MQQFDEKAKEDLKKRLDDLIEKGRGKKNVLDYQEITDAFQDMKLDSRLLRRLKSMYFVYRKTKLPSGNLPASKMRTVRRPTLRIST